MSQTIKTKSRRTLRIEIINALYSAEVMNEKIQVNQFFEADWNLSNEQFEALEKISKNYDYYKKLIEKFIAHGWTWERLSPLHRAIFLNATNEFFVNMLPKIVINEAIEICKLFFDDSSYKMVNGILQNIYSHLVVTEMLSRQVEKYEK